MIFESLKQIQTQSGSQLQEALIPRLLTNISALEPDVVIMGGGLADADDPVDEARKIREAIEKHETEGSRQ